jgi:hypothetical protein
MGVRAEEPSLPEAGELSFMAYQEWWEKSGLKVLRAEQPVWSLGEIADRAKNESVWHEGTVIKANITVQGWLKPNGLLWKEGDQVAVDSPMALLNMGLKIESTTFTQDSNSGTLKDTPGYDNETGVGLGLALELDHGRARGQAASAPPVSHRRPTRAAGQSPGCWSRR